MNQKENKNKFKIRLKTVAGLFFIITIYCAIYILLEYRSNGFAVLAGVLLVVIAGYLLVTFSDQEKNELQAEQEAFLSEKLDEMISVQKALYTAVKKNNETVCREMENLTASQNSMDSLECLRRISSMQERMLSENKRLAEAQINAMKAVAKYNKENARQLAASMNENTDRLMSRMAEGGSGNSEELLESLKAGTAGMEQRISRKIQEAIYDVEERYQGMSEAMLSNTVTMTERIEKIGEQIGNFDFGDGVTAATMERAGWDSDAVMEEDALVEDEPEPEKIAEPEADAAEEAAPVAEPEILPEPEEETVEEVVSIEEPEVIAEPEPTPEPMPEPAKEKPEMPVIDDPNRAMTPDEIAAMIAALTGETGAAEPEATVEAVEEAVPIEEPEVIAEPEPTPEPMPEPAKEKPEMPVIDDPNRAMTPDEIAAMIAALTQ